MTAPWQRLTIVVHSLSGGGSEHAAAEMASYWAESGRDVVLLTLDSVENDQIDFSQAVKRVGLNVMSSSHGLFSALTANRKRINVLREALVASQPDRIISLTDRTNILTLLAARRVKLPVVVSERTDIRHHPIGRVWSWLRKRTYPAACSIVVQTEAVKPAVQCFAAGTSVHVIPNAVSQRSAASSTRDLELAPERSWFVAVGRLSYEKGFDQLLAAFAEAISGCPNWNLAIIGDGPEKSRLMASVQRYGLGDRVLFPGWIESPWEVVPKASVVVLPSRYEGFPNVLLESMSRGLAAIAFDCESGPAEIIRSGVDGLLIPAGDVTELATGMQKLANDPDLRARLGEAAQEVNDRFSPERVYAKWESVLNDSE